MKRRIRVTRMLGWFSLFAFAASGFADQAQAPRAGAQETRAGAQEARAFKVFAARVQQYVKLQKAVEASLPALKPTNEAERITEHQGALARKIAQARSGAHQGDIFTPEVTRQFRRIIRDEFAGPQGQLARNTIRPENPSEALVRLRVNDVYPETIPLTSTPPTLLSKLPELPQELAYRIVGRDLTLKDTKAGLIVDLIPNAIP